ncbi:MAG: cytochrome bc complex cytochrome b subunit [Chloroflexi bacterium]|nr:cytochrome bc complex cytochrome b subunit [Chloroflexota bacterium]
MSIFQAHIPILDDIKANGLKPTALAKVNETVERITAGIDINEIRSILRGDPPRRPNPRVKPHADGFWLHMRPTYYHNLTHGLYPSFRLGWLSTYFVVFETLTGIFLMVYYTPSPLVAYENMLDILSNVPLGRLMRDLHKLGAELMVIVVSLHALRTFLTGNYKKPRQFTWFTGWLLLWITLILSFSGYLLPWDQLSLWAVTIGASMAEAVPPQVVGDAVNLIVRGAPQFGAGGLLRFYLLHVLALPLILFVFLGVHYYKVVIHGHSLPPEAEEVGEDTAKRVPMDRRTYFMPDVLTKELFYVAVLTSGLVLWSIFLYHAPLEPHADPLVTPLHTTAPWYFLWLQGMLKIGDKVLWGVIMPGLIVNLGLVIPYLEVGPSRRYGDRRVGLMRCLPPRIKKWWRLCCRKPTPARCARLIGARSKAAPIRPPGGRPHPPRG